MDRKQNCWEFKNCGREIGGAKVEEMGLCPSAKREDFNGMNHGVNGGRVCWVVGGTYCGGEVQGTFGMKYGNCKKCDFFQKVKEEEKLTNVQILLQHYLRK